MGRLTSLLGGHTVTGENNIISVCRRAKISAQVPNSFAHRDSCADGAGPLWSLLPSSLRRKNRLFIQAAPNDSFRVSIIGRQAIRAFDFPRDELAGLLPDLLARQAGYKRESSESGLQVNVARRLPRDSREGRRGARGLESVDRSEQGPTQAQHLGT